MKNKYYVYISLFLLLCLIPSAGLLFTGIVESSENREQAPEPRLIVDDRLNPYFLNEAGSWFEDHFAFRKEAVTACALLLEKGFGVSAQDGVITGTDGWLFYKDSLADFQGTEPMTGRQLFDVAHSLAMIQEYAHNHGTEFVFAAAPDKNSLYGQYMPYYYQPSGNGKSNLRRLEKYLEAEQVNYTDLYSVFQSDGRILYHKRDSHWNNQGAALAASHILNSAGKEPAAYTDRPYITRKDFTGDLDCMLYPAMPHPEEEYYYNPSPQFTYCEEVENNFAPKITTRSDGSGNLLMYRDSFGNALLPFLAEAFKNACFSRALPYQIPEITDQNADVLIIERAERFLPDMARQAPVMEAPSVDMEAAVRGTAVKADRLKESRQGSCTQITGFLNREELNERSRIYIRVNGETCYEAFPVCDAEGLEGFSMLLRTESLQEKDNVFEVYVSEQAAAACNEDQTGSGDPESPEKKPETINPEEKTEIRREDYPDCDGSGHGYIEIYYSDGSVETEEY